MDVHLRICGRELLETEPVPNVICERFPPGAGAASAAYLDRDIPRPRGLGRATATTHESRRRCVAQIPVYK
jgi:hypothetical protein